MAKNYFKKTATITLGVVFSICLFGTNAFASGKIAEYISYLDESIIHDDGSLESTSHYIIKIFNKELVDLSELDISLNKATSSLDSMYIRVTYDDGSYEEPDPKKVIRETPQYEGINSLSDEVLYKLSLPQLKNDSYLEIITKCKRIKSSDTKIISSIVKMGSKYPSKLWQVHLVYPNTVNLHYKLNHGNGRIKVRKDPELGGLWFETKDLSGIKEEMFRPPDLELIPTVLISNLSSFSEIANWHNSQLSSDHYEITAPLDKIIDSLDRESGADRYVLAQKVYEWTIKNLKKYQGSLKAGKKQQRAMDVYKNGGLDCRDEASFLVALYRYFDFEAYPAWISREVISKIDRSFPIQAFDHAITALKVEGKYIFLDATSRYNFGTLPFKEQGRPAIILFSDGSYQLETTPFMSPSDSQREKKVTIAVNKNGSLSEERKYVVSGEEKVEMSWLKYLTDKQLKGYFKGTYVGKKNELVNYELKDGEIDLKLRSSVLGPKEGQYYLMQDPGQYLFNEKMFATEKRDFDLILGEQKTIKTFYKIKLPNNFVIKKLPAQINENNAFFSLKRNVTYDPLVGEMNFTEIFERKVNVVKKQDYKKFKKEYDSLVKKGLNQDWSIEVK